MIFPTMLLFLLGFSIVSARDIHVNQGYTGTEQDGTIEMPYTTIQQAVDAASGGDVIHIMSGTYREQVEIGIDSITIKNYQNDKVIVTGAEPVLEWELYEGEVYWAIVPWDITENNESNQVFANGEMMHLTRWPKENSERWVTDPTMGIVDQAENSGAGGVILTDEEFNEPPERWLGGMIWINLANDADGQGWSGEASYISSSLNLIKAEPTASSSIFAGEKAPWAIRRGTKYYLFNPTPVGVYATGGPGKILSRGEWWKNGDTLYVRLPNGEKPASIIGEANLVEAKKRLWAFLPKESDFMHHVTIQNLHLFAASITTDRIYTRANLAVNSHHNIIDGIHARYVSHFIDQTGHYQNQWYGKTGIILSGVENVLQNSTIIFTAAAAVTAFGNKHKIIGNQFYETNYQCTETGVINGGHTVKLLDPEIAYNYINNTTQKVVAIGNIYSSNPDQPGLINLHHNVISNFMLRSSDSGAMNASAGRNWDLMRVHHNVILNSFTEVSIGVYTDYGGQAIIDHNVIWNVKMPILMNRYNPKGENQNGAIPLTNEDLPMGEIWVYNNLAINTAWFPGIVNNIVNPSGEGMHYKNNIVSNRINATLELVEELDSNLYISKNDVDNLFVDYDNLNFQLNPASGMAIDKGADASPYNDTIVNGIPDIGPYEFGVEPWKAGPEGVITYLKMNQPQRVFIGDTVTISAMAYTNGLINMEPQPRVHYWTNGYGSIDSNGIFIATEPTDRAIIYATADSLTVESVAFRIREPIVDAINDLAIDPKSGIEINIFPNPAETSLTLAIESTKTSNKPVFIEIYSLASRVVYTKEFQFRHRKFKHDIDISSLKQGIYFLRVRHGSDKAHLKFIKKE